MLIGEAIHRRKLGAFPALRKVLENKPRSDRYCSLTSVSDNIFEAFQRFLDISALATGHKGELCTAAHGNPQFAEAAIDDLERLMNELQGIKAIVSNEILDLGKLCEEVHHASRYGAP